VRILADENIMFVRQAFAALGEVRTMPGREVRCEHVRDVDVLLVRSVTQVNAELIGDSPVRFVATATIGTDHVDTSLLAQRGIGFAAAEGCNANSVAEYVVSALLTMSSRLGRPLAGQRLGVVGVGRIGGRVVRYARALGMDVLMNDPPRQRAEGGDFVSLDQVLDESDVVTLHVPLTLGGPDATVHLIGPGQLALMRPQAVLINTSRGEVVDAPALQAAVQAGRVRAVIDTWPYEPGIDCELLSRVDLGTAHVAGYSADGKLNGTVMIYQAACQHLGIRPTWSPAGLLAPPERAELWLSEQGDDESATTWAVWQAYDISRDDEELRKLLALPAADRAGHFDALRAKYPYRREFGAYTVKVPAARTPVAVALDVLGFQVRQ
jgi:erythronate-4-phosphate dehydrogenase